MSEYRGLVNEGSTCYLNSLLQTLFMTPEFRDGIYGWTYLEKQHPARADSILGQMQARFPTSVDAYERATLSYMYGDGPEDRAQAALSTLRRRIRGGTELDRWLATCATAWWDGRHGDVCAGRSSLGVA